MADAAAVPVEDRRSDYDRAEGECREVSRRWIAARAAGRMTLALDHEMDFALAELGRVKRRLEKAERRQAA